MINFTKLMARGYSQVKTEGAQTVGQKSNFVADTSEHISVTTTPPEIDKKLVKPFSRRADLLSKQVQDKVPPACNESIASQDLQTTGVVPTPWNLEPRVAQLYASSEALIKGLDEIDIEGEHKDAWLNPEPEHFMMRRIPIVGVADTVSVEPLEDGRFLLKSEHGLGRSYADADIKLLHRPKNVIRRGKLFLGVNEQKKHILLQPGTRSCTAAATFMLIADHGAKINEAAILWCNLGTDEDMEANLKAAGLTPIETTVTSPAGSQECAREVRGLLQTHGSAIISVNSGLGGHVVILDEISANFETARIRDSYHGWDITINYKTLLDSCGLRKLLHAKKSQR